MRSTSFMNNPAERWVRPSANGKLYSACLNIAARTLQISSWEIPRQKTIRKFKRQSYAAGQQGPLG